MMNIGALTAAIAGASAARARTEVLDAFRVHEATSVARACLLADLDLAGGAARLDGLLRAGVIRAVDRQGRTIEAHGERSSTDRFYLDEGALITQRTSSPKRQALQVALVLLLVVALILAGGVVFRLR